MFVVLFIPATTLKRFNAKGEELPINKRKKKYLPVNSRKNNKKADGLWESSQNATGREVGHFSGLLVISLFKQ